MSDVESPRLPGVDDDPIPDGPPARFTRPWEQPLDQAEPNDDEPGDRDTSADDEELDLSISEQIYLSATTAEYRDLAEEVARTSQEEPINRPAVAAAIAGVGSGLVDFEDVTGQKGISEEEVEHVEQAATSDLTMRVITALVLIGLFLGTLILGGWWFTLFVTVVMVVALGEFYSTLRREGYVPLALFGLLGVVGAGLSAQGGRPSAILVSILLAALAVILFMSVVPRRRALDNAALTVLGSAWVALLGFAVIIGRSQSAIALILLVVLVSALFDIGSYFVGRAFGRTRMAPVISPRKTWEGFVGGAIAAAGTAAILATVDFFPIEMGQAMILSLLVVVLAPLGDGAESMIKRSLGVKDMGNALPGHGGMLDRIDSLLFVLPAVYLFFHFAGLL
ncbi:MAG TPA: phosphatidate cytidylyltransferase [Acidimicrobiia bacterium]|nr:phosphatidate cytidylyltransferase [Acidimicrobiia bacterium]